MHKYYQVFIIKVTILSIFLFGLNLTVSASDKSTPMTNIKKGNMNYSLNVLGKYYDPENNKKLELKTDGSFSMQKPSLHTNGKFKMDNLTEITFERWGGKIAKGSFKGNDLTDPDGNEWIKTVNNKDIAGKYYNETDKNNYLELKTDGSLTIFESTIKVNGKYTIGLDDIALSLQDPTGKHPDEIIKVKFGGDIPGRGHDILVDNGSGIYFIKKFEKIEIIAKYIQEDTNGNNSLELMADGSFIYQTASEIINGVYIIDGDVIILILGGGGPFLTFTAHIKNKYLTIEGIYGLEGKRWQKQ